jgi:hypothetical protein
MTEDILFGNIYVGHSVEDAKQLAAETFDVKHALEEAADKPADLGDTHDDEEVNWKADPIAFIRQKVFTFIELAKIDPVLALKTKPETAGAIIVAIFTVFGMLGTVIGVVGGQQKPAPKVSRYQNLSAHILTWIPIVDKEN